MTKKATKPDKGEYEDTPKGWAERWKDEFASAKPMMTKFHKAGDKVLKVFLNEGKTDDDTPNNTLNLFHANVAIMQAMLYGQLPKVEVDRTFADANDDTARVAAEILDRMLNQDIQRAGDDYGTILRSSLSDRLLPGIGSARVRYDFASTIRTTPAINHPTTGEELAPAVNEEVITDEWVDTVYTHWKDLKWSPARTHSELRWKAYRSYMNKDELTKRFPDARIDQIPMTSKGPLADNKGDSGPKLVCPQAEVWEIWNLENRKVYWVVETFPVILDEMDDPLELDQFFPDPPPMIANVTTSKYLPKSDYAMAQDLYQAIDELEERLGILTDACKLVGVYDKAQDDIKRLMNEGVESQLIPVANWAMFAEKGGLESLIQWLPIEDVVNTIEKLSAEQDKKIQKLYEFTGMADIMRGASQQAYTSAAETKTKAQFASIRVQALQDDFARWASNLQSLKAEIICKHYQPDSIIKQSNIMMTTDAGAAQDAVNFLKSDSSLRWRIIVKPESLALADYQQMKADRTEFMMAVAQFMQSAAPLAQMDQGFTPYLLQILQWGMSGFKGSNQIEGVMDKAIKTYQDKAAQAAANPPPDPNAAAAQAKIQQIQQEGQIKIQIMQQQAASDQQSQQMKQQMELERSQADHQAYLAQLQFQQKIEQQKFDNQMEILKAELVVNIAKLTSQQQADASAKAVDLIHTAEQARIQANADTAVMTHGANTDMAVTQHKADTTKEVAAHAAKVQAKSQDTGNGASK